MFGGKQNCGKVFIIGVSYDNCLHIHESLCYLGRHHGADVGAHSARDLGSSLTSGANSSFHSDQHVKKCIFQNKQHRSKDGNYPKVIFFPPKSLFRIKNIYSAKTLRPISASIYTLISVVFGSIHWNIIIPGTLATHMIPWDDIPSPLDDRQS